MTNALGERAVRAFEPTEVMLLAIFLVPMVLAGLLFAFA
jgi:hypothetical protein